MIKNVKLIFILTTLLVTGCNLKAPKSSSLQEKQKIDSLFDAFSEDKLKFYPILATKAGDKRYNDMLPNHLSREYLDSLKAMYSRYKLALANYDKEKLSESQRMSYEVLEWECDINLEGLNLDPGLILIYDGMNFSFSYMPINQFWSANLFMGQLASGKSMQPFKTIADYDNWLKRVDDFMIWCDTALGNMKKGVVSGQVLPKALIEKVIPQMANFSQGAAKEHLFYKPILSMPHEFSDEDKLRLTTSYTTMIDEKVIPKFTKLHQFFSMEYLKAGRQSSGFCDLPGGEKAYNFLIKYFTTTDMTADEIFELGNKEVERLTSEMEKLKDQLGFKGDLNAFFEHVRENKDLMPFTDPQQVIDNFNAIHAKMKPNLAVLFDLTPNTAFEVRRTEAFREKSASAQYNPGATDGSRPGVFYVPIPDATKYNVFSDEDLFVHEAIPGHHFQISLQQENKDLPGFQRILWQSAFGEGWALYTEFLGPELGLYKDPYQYFGMLSAEMHRAVRLVLDVGIHAKGWTREQAIKYALGHEAKSESAVVPEIERYMALPGQALSYKIGQLKIIELRKKAEKSLGNKFEIKQFHNKVLESGCIPLKLLEDKINRWIEAKTKEI